MYGYCVRKILVVDEYSYGGNQVLVYISRVSVSDYDNKLLNTSTSTLGLLDASEPVT